ncbi:hypothetical protein EW145_g2671 [Phellinidium pouzarii]|uniref:REM-1 domain-containing protein n=1 Tax=Phellinidium pouzarii TaxID=167371 RepID=A0A4S4LAF4_9AGAM|nr:hypothetical protein EW145_g2671 [Phellinidium pouzarii]
MPMNISEGGLAVPQLSLDGGISGETNFSASGIVVNGTPRNTLKTTDGNRTLASRPSNMTLVNDAPLNGGGISFPELDGREPVEQLATLNEMLEKATRLKEGAVNFLKMEMADSVRMRVETELGQANSRIEAIIKAIETVGSRRKNTFGRRTQSPVTVKRRHDTGQLHHRDDGGGKDFRTAKQQAIAALKTLLVYVRHTSSPSSVSSASSSAGSPPPSTEAALEEARIEIMNRLIVVLQRNASTKTRATAYRLLRHALVDRDSVERLLENPLEWYIVKSLTRDNKHAGEREQAIKLVRAIIEVGAERRVPHMSAGLGCVPLSEPVMRALIAVADHAEDPFCQICCETLVEILLIDVDLVVRTGGARVLFQALSEGPIDLIPLIATAFLYIVDAPKTRAYMHPGTDLEIALSGITDAYGKGPSHAERMRSTGKVATVILRTWSGLMYLCMDDMLAIRTMINTLRIPSLETREVVLDMFFELLNIQTPEWYQTFIDGRRLTMYRRHRPLSQQPKEQEILVKTSDKLKLTDQYIALLTAILTKAGLLDALVAMLEETTLGSNLSRKATLLMGEVLQIANRVLPLGFAAKLQTVPRIFALAADYGEGEHRIIGTTALAAIDSFNRHRARLQPAAPARDSRQRANSVEDHVRRRQRQVEQVKIKLAMQMDDRTFQASIIETQVMLTQDYTKWNYDILLDLVEGPLLSAKRLEEAIKVSKFVKRLMAFFHPYSHRFADMKKTKTNTKWIKLGCTLLTTLMANPDGVRYLQTEDELLPQIVKSFEQLYTFNGSNMAPELDPIFSKRRVEETLTSGYLEMLGILSKQKDGLELLEKHRAFTAFYHLSELRSREDLIKGIIENIDYTNDGHPRIVLSKALTSSYKHIRLYATKHLGKLIQASPNASAWMLRLLLTQLYDPDPSVCELAVQFLEEACESQDILKIVVEMQPTLEHLGEVANSLLYKFMSTPVGFRYLYEVGFIEREMDMWLHERNFNYVVEVEVYLSRELNSSSADDFEDDQTFDGTVPPHFYGELAKTELGCQHALECDDFEIIFKLKSVLWAVGNVASAEGGLHFLEEEEIIPVMLEIAECSPILSVRGTAFFAIGLVSSTAQGAEILDDYGWESTLSPLGFPTGLCIPANIEKFVSIPAWGEPLSQKTEELSQPTLQEEVDVLTAIGNLANTVIANAASRSLARMKSKSEYRHAFSSPSLYYRVLHTISTQTFRLPVRRYILELFDIPLDANVVRTLVLHSKSLVDTSAGTSPSHAQPRLQPRVSVFGRPVRGRDASESDIDDDESMEESDEDALVLGKPPAERPVSLLPVRRVAGFDGVDQDEEDKPEGVVHMWPKENIAVANEHESRIAALARRRSMSGSSFRHNGVVDEGEDE